MIARVAAFRDYSVFFVDDGTSYSCYVQTWDEHELFCVCVLVEASGQKVPNSELACLSRVVDSIVSCQLPMSCQGGSASLLRVLNDNRVDGRQFVLGQEFSEEAFLQCFREAHQEVFGILEVTSMVDFLVLRLCGALQEPWMEDVTVVRRSQRRTTVTSSIHGSWSAPRRRNTKKSTIEVHVLYSVLSLGVYPLLTCVASSRS